MNRLFVLVVAILLSGGPAVWGQVTIPSCQKEDKDHIMSVAYLSSRIAERWGIDKESTVKAAMLHDLFYYDWHDGEWWHRPHGLRHPAFALVNARLLCGKEIDERVENSILRHMWPLTVIPPKYAEGYALTIADKICASLELYYTKTPERREKLRRMIDQINEAGETEHD